MEYELEIITKDKKGKEKVFKLYEIDGIDTIGVNESEPFGIRLRNNTNSNIQARISIDGTDVITGELANTESKGQMWLVRAHDYMQIDAWPETNSGGARFVFGSEGNSVAKNTHGNLSAKGLIAAAIFTEAYEPINFGIPKNTISNSDIYYGSSGISYGEYSGVVPCSAGVGETYSSNSINIKDSTKSGPAVGAGEYTEQTITKEAGLREPKFHEVIQLKYKWWNELREEISQYKEPPVAHNAFPGDAKKMIDLKSTPRVRSLGKRRDRKRSHQSQRFV